MKPSELIESAKLALQERIGSPLFGSFILSWCVWNYRFLLVMFSDLKFVEKISYIDVQLYPTVWTAWLHYVVGPLITTVAIIYIYPYPAKWAFEYWRKRQRELHLIRIRIDNETPLTNEQSREIRQRMFEQALEHEKLITWKDQEIESLRKRLGELENKAQQNAMKTSFFAVDGIEAAKSQTQLPDISMKILPIVAKNRRNVGDLAVTLKEDGVNIQYGLDRLKEVEFVRVDNDGDWGVTEKGRAFVVESHMLPTPTRSNR